MPCELHHPLRVAALLLGASLFACSSEPTGPQSTSNLAEVLNEASLSSLSGFSDIGAVLIAAPVMMPVVASGSPSSCGYDAASQRFVCAPVTSGGITFTRAFTLYDAAGSAQSQFSPTSTASLRTTSHLSGTVASAGSTFTIDNVDEGTVSGLLTGRHVLNGTSTSTTAGTFSGGPRAPTSEAMSNVSVAKIEGLVLPSRANKYPGPGTITADATFSFGTLPATTMHSVVQFTGTRCVTVSIAAPGSAPLIMSIDLSNPSATSCRP